MGIDSEFIGSENFNLKFKNYLNGFYVYQFFEKKDFKQKGNKIECQLITALKPGTTTITARTSNNLVATCNIIVENSTRSKKAFFAENEVILNIGDSYKPELIGSNNGSDEIEWISSSNDIVTINQGEIYAKASGETKVKAKCGKMVAECKVIVAEAPERIQFKTEKIKLNTGNVRKLQLNFFPKKTNSSVVLKTTNETVAKVVNNKVIGVGAGNCDIIATTSNGCTAVCNIDVVGEKVNPESIRLDCTESKCAVGEQLRLSAFMLPQNASDLEVVWEVSDPSVALLSSQCGIAMSEQEILNKNIVESMFNYDTDRLKNTLEEAAGVQWKKGDYVDSEKKIVDESKNNVQVECITMDSRSINSNPFHLLYKNCSEASIVPGLNFTITYFIVLYLNLYKKTEYTIPQDLSEDEKVILDENLKLWGSEIISRENRNASSELLWDRLSDYDKRKYAQKVIEAYMYNPSNYSKIMGYKDDAFEGLYDFIIENKKKIVYSNNKFKLVDDDCDYVELGDLFKVAQRKIGLENKQKKQFINKLQELEHIGVIQSKKKNQRLYYALSPLTINDIVIENENFNDRFVDMLSFFSETAVLGVVGDFLIERLGLKKSDHFYYKHNYFKRALNSFNIIDLMYAIKNHKWIDVEYRNNSISDMKYHRIIGYPLGIKESVIDGRQYLLIYHSGYRSLSALRVEFIDSISVGDYPKDENFDNDFANAMILKDYTWGASFSGFDSGNVKNSPVLSKVRIVVRCPEDFIKNRLKREKRTLIMSEPGTFDGIENCIELEGELADVRELLQWLRSFITRVVSVQVDGEAWTVFNDDINELYRRYYLPIENETSSSNFYPKKDLDMMKGVFAEKFKAENCVHNYLFNEFFSTSFKKLGTVLDDIILTENIDEETLAEQKEDYCRDDKKEIIVDKDKKEKREKEFLNFSKSFVKDNISLFTLIQNSGIGDVKELLPLTKIERHWLNYVLESDFSNMFLSDEEIDFIRKKLNCEKYFDEDIIVLFDQFSDIKDFYKNPGVKDISKDILCGLANKNQLSVFYRDQTKKEQEYLCSPGYIEYSRRDNRFRLYALVDDTPMIFNFERIIKLEVNKDKHYKPSAVREDIKKKQTYKELHVIFKNSKNVPDRILTEFSCYKKKAVKYVDGQFWMTLYYDVLDTKEIAIRLLAYGPHIFVCDDSGAVRHEMVERIRTQFELTREMEYALNQDEMEI